MRFAPKQLSQFRLVCHYWDDCSQRIQKKKIRLDFDNWIDICNNDKFMISKENYLLENLSSMGDYNKKIVAVNQLLDKLKQGQTDGIVNASYILPDTTPVGQRSQFVIGIDRKFQSHVLSISIELFSYQDEVLVVSLKMYKSLDYITPDGVSNFNSKYTFHGVSNYNRDYTSETLINGLVSMWKVLLIHGITTYERDDSYDGLYDYDDYYDD
jgi:hypothetical protein